MKLYAVRGVNQNFLNRWPSNWVWLSGNFDVTMLYKNGHTWRPRLLEDNCVCYESFSKLTGVVLEPGEYTTIEVTTP